MILNPLGGTLAPVALSEREKAILDFERSWWTQAGPKRAAMRARLGLSTTRYYQLLSALVGSADAAAYDPLVIHRLRRNLRIRRRARVEGRPAGQPLGR